MNFVSCGPLLCSTSERTFGRRIRSQRRPRPSIPLRIRTPSVSNRGRWQSPTSRRRRGTPSCLWGAHRHLNSNPRLKHWSPARRLCRRLPWRRLRGMWQQRRYSAAAAVVFGSSGDIRRQRRWYLPAEVRGRHRHGGGKSFGGTCSSCTDANKVKQRGSDVRRGRRFGGEGTIIAAGSHATSRATNITKPDYRLYACAT